MKIASATVLVALLGSAAQAQAQTLDPKVVSAMLASQTLAKPLALSSYSWSPGTPPTQLPPVATHLCIVSEVTGKLAGGGELVQLYIDKGATGGARFMLGGHSQQPLRITATCAPKEQFVRANAVTPLAEQTFDVATSSGCAARVFPVPSGSSALFVAGITGRFAGDGESVTAGLANKSGALTVQSCSGSAGGSVLSIGQFLGTPRYRTATGTSTDANASTFVASYKSNETGSNWQYFVGGLTGNANIKHSGTGYVYPALANDALCGIVAIRGKFNGFGEHATLEVADYNGQKWWRASVSTGVNASEPSVSVAVRCFARDQRPK